MKTIMIFCLIAFAGFAQTRPPDEIATNFTSASSVNAALLKAQAAITGSGTSNQIAYFTGATTLGSLATSTYPSLTELSRLKGITSPIMTLFSNKQDVLVSGQNIKTINNQPIIGSGNITITAGSDTTGLWQKVYNIVISLPSETIIGNKATLDSMIVDFRKNNYLRLNK